jgi:hypothetical protein
MCHVSLGLAGWAPLLVLPGSGGCTREGSHGVASVIHRLSLTIPLPLLRVMLGHTVLAFASVALCYWLPLWRIFNLSQTGVCSCSSRSCLS